ncbi:hypothetical protein G9A89_009789 [Geosiphon pyriformis]|nr:hypothetical protein G9A89_009789 [Geosiphon pyriformis]
MKSISFDKMFSVISSLPDKKAAEALQQSGSGYAFGAFESLPGLEAWKGVLMNTCPITLIKTACKILSKILLDRISSAYSEFNILQEDNFSVLKGTTMQSPIFAIGSVNIHKAYDSVGWEHLKRSLIRIKMLGMWFMMVWIRVKFSHHFSGAYFMICLCAELTLFFAAGVFVDDTIWVGSSQATTQHILDIASEFFRINDISINNNKTVAIPINCRVETSYLTVSGLSISIAKKGKPYYYLGILLSFNSLSVSSLAKTHSDIQFFVNLVLKKTISDKQFSYLVFAVLFLIVSYRTQFSFVPISVCNKWDALIHKSLKSKSELLLDFSNDALHHPSLYGLKTFEQIQAESKLVSIIAFANSVGILGHLFSYRSHDLQVLSWHPHHLLLFLARVSISSSNNFLADVVCIFSRCDLSLGGSLHWKRLDPHGLIPFWFDLSVCFLGGVASFFACSSLVKNSILSDVHQSYDFSVICDNLLATNTAHFSVYTDGSLSGLGIVVMKAGAVVFFEDINSGLGVGVSGLVSSTMSELQAIALALECVPSSCAVDLFLDSQVALDVCKLESLLAQCYHIANVICHKNLTVNWIKVKSHLGISDNEHVDELAKDVALSTWHLPHLVSKRFLKAESNVVSGNSRHFVGSGSQILAAGLHNGVNWSKSTLVWHPNSHLAAGFTSACTLSVTVHKHLYDKCYLSVVCLFCGDVEFSDHVFICPFDAAGHAQLLNAHLLASCFSNATISTTLCKGFDAKVAASNIVCFVHEFCFTFYDKFWLVHAKHQAFMERNRLIPHDGSIPALVSGLPMVLLAGMIRLLGVVKAFGVGFSFRKPLALHLRRRLLSAFCGLAGGFFSQKKKVVLGNVKHSGNEKNLFLSKFGSNGSVYSDVESLSNEDEDVSMSETNGGSLLGSAAITPKTK